MTFADNTERSDNPHFNLPMFQAKYSLNQHPISIVFAWIATDHATRESCDPGG